MILVWFDWVTCDVRLCFLLTGEPGARGLRLPRSPVDVDGSEVGLSSSLSVALVARPCRGVPTNDGELLNDFSGVVSLLWILAEDLVPTELSVQTLDGGEFASCCSSRSGSPVKTKWFNRRLTLNVLTSYFNRQNWIISPRTNVKNNHY